MIWFQGIKNITDALAAKGLLKDTLIVFTTDNGGWPCAGAHHIASHLISLLLPLTCSLLQAAPTCHYGRYSCSQVNMPTACTQWLQDDRVGGRCAWQRLYCRGRPAHPFTG